MEQVKMAGNAAAVSATDIPFDCPACGKSLVVDEAAEGLIVDCPQCRTNVIVPPKSSRPETSEKDSRFLSEDSRPRKRSGIEPNPDEAVDSVTLGTMEPSLEQRLAVLSGQLKEIQAQRTEVTGRIASRLNDVNRDLVIIARLETSQQQILSEWNRLVERISATRAPAPDDVAQPVVIGASVTRGGRTRVSFPA
jgi:DNA-directed RNA polymerase subunit RPC12/RpoP